MSRLRPVYSPALALIATGLVLIAALGGCPVAQQPATPPADDPNQNTNTPPPNPDNDIDRPVPPPPPPPNDTTVGGGNGNNGPNTPTGPNNPPGGGNGGGGSGFSAVGFTISAPGGNVRVRPGSVVNVVFSFLDPTGFVQGVELLVARDDDANNTADGAPVLTQPLTPVSGNNTVPLDTQALVNANLLVNNAGRFKLGVRARAVNGEVRELYSSGSVVVDGQAPTGSWIGATTDLLTNPKSVPLPIRTIDNTPVTITVSLDEDLDPTVGLLQTLVGPVQVGAGTVDTTLQGNLAGIVPGRTYNIYVTISDGIEPPFSFYVERAPGDPVKWRVTRRLIGDVEVARYDNSNDGFVLFGFNFNDLAGSSITSVPDLNGDDIDELLIGSRFGKAYVIENNGVGFGEAYMLYGQPTRFKGRKPLNSAGSTLPGLIFPGIRTPRSAAIVPSNQSTRWTEGLSGITVIPDMDGDDLPELVFSFPRVESISLGVTNPTIQHPELAPDLPGMGALEYNAFYGNPPFWHINEAQFARGGIVIVSSQNEMLRNPNLLNRKSDRVFDLHETGQLFSAMNRPDLVPYVAQVVSRGAKCADCDGLPPSGWQPGELADLEPDPNTWPEGCNGNPLDPNCGAQPGDCGDDGCVDPAAPITQLQDGREALLGRFRIRWDVVFNNQGPGGFHQNWTAVPAFPPLANPVAFPFNLTNGNFPFAFYPNLWNGPLAGGTFNTFPACPDCEITNEWFGYGPIPATTAGSPLAPVPSWSVTGTVLQNPLPNCYPDNIAPVVITPEEGPCPTPAGPPATVCPNPALTPNANGNQAWTGFYAPGVSAFVGTQTGQVFPTPIGARVLGQRLEDRFGTSVAADGDWLYISAPNRSANGAYISGGQAQNDVPSLAGQRANSGVVYQLRTRAPGPNGVTRTQLWLERGVYEVDDPNSDDPNDVLLNQISWPNVDIEDPFRTDYTMPVPHQYIIETVGSLRGNPDLGVENLAFGAGDNDCPPAYPPGVDEQNPFEGATAGAVALYQPYPVGTSGFYMDRTPQIVGPHANARISVVRSLGDLNDDGIRDFAVGSEFVTADVAAGTGDVVGALFLVYGRPTGVEGDYLLEQLSFAENDPNRLNGVLIRGTSAGETLARVVADAGDFNGDGVADVIIGNEGADGGVGEAIIVLGSPTLLSPQGGWTPDQIPAERSIRFRGANAGDLAGANVSGLGDIDGDGLSDVAIAAPGADGGKGAVYVIYGSEELEPVVQLGDLSTTNVNVAYARLSGRLANDFLGGGLKVINGTAPAAGSSTRVFSSGLAPLGDIDGDGLDDFAVSSMLASPNNRTNAGEVYVIYGNAGP